MKYVFYTNIVSPHQLPWCREFVKLVGEENFLYLATESLHSERAELGWREQNEKWIRILGEDGEGAQLQSALEDCEVLFCSLREFELIARRTKRGLKTYYMFERWFKPPFGMLRMMHPGYWRMCRRALNCFESETVRLLPIGIYATLDVVRMADLLHRGAFRPPQIAEPYRPMASVQRNGNPLTFSMRLWGYFVKEPQESPEIRPDGILRILWCGRMLNWKRTDTLVKAAVSLLDSGVSLRLQLIGHGPEESGLKNLAGKWLNPAVGKSGIELTPPIEIGEVRLRMRSSDVYVLSSDGGEGWGAVANEAMNEGMLFIGTYEAGSSATLVANGYNGFLYHAGDTNALSRILRLSAEMKQHGTIVPMQVAAQETISEIWGPRAAAEALAADIAAWESPHDSEKNC